MVEVTYRPITPEERERLVRALQQEALENRGLLRWVLGGKRAAARAAEDGDVVTVVTLDCDGGRALMKCNAQPGDWPAWLLALDDQRLLLVASLALPSGSDPQSETSFPHPRMIWTIGPHRALLDYSGEGPSLLVNRPARVSEQADRVLHRSFELIDGHVFPGTLRTCVKDLERYVAALPAEPETIPMPGDANGLPDECFPEETDD